MPVRPASVVAHLRTVADEVVFLQALHFLGSVGAWYHDFTQTTDAEVTTLVTQAAQPATAASPPITPHPLPNREVRIPAAGVQPGRTTRAYRRSPGRDGLRAQQRQQPARPPLLTTSTR
ncbi:hypothetical protein [Streptomyces chartreusis]